MPRKSRGGMGSLGAALRAFVGATEAPTPPPPFEVKNVTADSSVLDRVASLNLALAERLAPVVADPEAPKQALDTYLGAVREVRAAVQARHAVTGGLGLGMAGTSGGGSSVAPTDDQSDEDKAPRIPRVLIEHSGQYVADDFNETAPGGARDGSDLEVSAEPPQA